MPDTVSLVKGLGKSWALGGNYYFLLKGRTVYIPGVCCI